MARRHKRKVLLLAAALLAAVALGLLMPARLSPLEQSVVGSWRFTDDVGSYALDLSPDRGYQFRRQDGQEIGPGLYALEGKWHIKGGVLVCDWRSRRQALLPVTVAAASSGSGGVRLPDLRWLRPEELEVIVVTGNELTLRPRHGGQPRNWKRYERPDIK